MTMQTKTWVSEEIETFLDDQAKVFVFRWVPNHMVHGGHRDEHPTFEEWLDEMRQAGQGLENPDVATREHYESVRTGVDGHRNATPEEIAERLAVLRREADQAEAKIKHLEQVKP